LCFPYSSIAGIHGNRAGKTQANHLLNYIQPNQHVLSAGLWSCEKDDNTNESGSGTTQVDPGTDPGAAWVDLGLPSGLLWGAHNVGASAPEDYGDHFAWGETESKEYYNWRTYRYCYGDWRHRLTKYCTKSDYGYNGFTDNLTILQPGDDAATANWGDGARTPP